MAQRYLLPCTNCDQKIAIETTQAGQSVRCSGCKSEIKIGTLREIRSLNSMDPVSGSGPTTRAKSQMSLGNRATFVVSALILAAGTIWGAMSLLDVNHLAGFKFEEALSPEMEKNLRSNLKNTSPIQFMEMWNKNVTEDAVAEWKEHRSLRIKRLMAEKKLFSWIGFGLAGLGLLGIAGSVLVTGSAKKPRR